VRRDAASRRWNWTCRSRRRKRLRSWECRGSGAAGSRRRACPVPVGADRVPLRGALL